VEIRADFHTYSIPSCFDCPGRLQSYSRQISRVLELIQTAGGLHHVLQCRCLVTAKTSRQSKPVCNAGRQLPCLVSACLYLHIAARRLAQYLMHLYTACCRQRIQYATTIEYRLSDPRYQALIFFHWTLTCISHTCAATSTC